MTDPFRSVLGAGGRLFGRTRDNLASVENAVAGAVVESLLNSGALPPELEARLRLGEEVAFDRDIATEETIVSAGGRELCRLRGSGDTIEIRVAYDVPLESIKLSVSIGGEALVDPDPYPVELIAGDEGGDE